MKHNYTWHLQLRHVFTNSEAYTTQPVHFHTQVLGPVLRTHSMRGLDKKFLTDLLVEGTVFSQKASRDRHPASTFNSRLTQLQGDQPNHEWH